MTQRRFSLQHCFAPRFIVVGVCELRAWPSLQPRNRRPGQPHVLHFSAAMTLGISLCRPWTRAAATQLRWQETQRFRAMKTRRNAMFETVRLVSSSPFVRAPVGCVRAPVRVCRACCGICLSSCRIAILPRLERLHRTRTCFVV